jgi:hypothetical protein
MRRLLASIVFVLGLLSAIAFAGEEPDAKPVDELMLMTDDELSAEAFAGCISSDTNYVDRVMRVARAKHQGQVPGWIKEYQAVAATGSPTGCADVSVKRLKERENTGKPSDPK